MMGKNEKGGLEIVWRKVLWIVSLFILAFSWVAYAQYAQEGYAQEVRTFQGLVFEDINRNGVFDAGERGIPGVGVSNGIEVVSTDSEGRYTLPYREEMVVFVIKPSQYELPLGKYRVPSFFYIHRPHGSPQEIREYPGIPPTGELPQSVDFPLYPGKVEENFRVLVFGDPQPFSHQSIGYLRDSIIREAKDAGALFVISLGDNVHDALCLYDRYLAVMAELGIPTFYVLGNHDMNYDSPNDTYSAETYTRHCGPPYYAFNYGKVHFVVLDSVVWTGSEYYGAISDEQLTWLKNDLSFVPEDYLIVVSMHIPPVSYVYRKYEKSMVKNREALFEVLKGRKALFLGGHFHTIERLFPGEVLHGWDSGLPFPQIVAGATCGAWWSGPKDADGIPLSYMMSPKGYFFLDIQGNEWRDTFKPYGMPVDAQMRITFQGRHVDGALPEGVFTQEELAGVRVIVNFFMGDASSQVVCEIDDRITLPMVHQPIADPYPERFLDAVPDWILSLWKNAKNDNAHIWVVSLPASLERGVHTLFVTATDRYGRVYQARKFFEVW